MTGPVERVPLTDAKLDELENFARDNGNILALGFIAELRESRAREQELQQRIDKALTECKNLDRIIRHFTSDSDSRATSAGASVAVAAVRAALTLTGPGQP